MEKKTIEVTLESKDKRIDEFLSLNSSYPSRTIASKAIKEGKVTIDGKIVKPSLKLKGGEIIEYEDYVAPASDLNPEKMDLDIIYEDDDVLLINKPQGLVVHPGSGHQEGTLANGLLDYLGEGRPGEAIRAGLLHRIDKDTSGLLLIAKNEEAKAFLQTQLQDHSMHREYIALVKGIIQEDEGKIDAPIGRDRIHPTKNAIDVDNGKESITFFKVEKRFYHDNVTLIRCRLLTGRTHQIRVHMEYIGHPVIGDPLYGQGNRKIYDKGQLLHAYRLTFTHPKNKKEMSFECDIPAYFQEIIDNLN